MINIIFASEIPPLRREIECGSEAQTEVEAEIAVKKTRLFRTFFSARTLYDTKHGGALVKFGTHRTAFQATDLSGARNQKPGAMAGFNLRRL
ncbi:hypothetical protein MUU53_03325 [Rhizobium lemnae]|uniref:Uncharacterized protein n=1 Tax=Rhizobium lemnae TaxID=1214924 RepID=A0ABV8E8L8_9HYPH|nr:hypothetical protein [Rhizobium lemnae]MCJ8506941.1 hypothetical protein [Rhizobium lemnae]